MMSKLEAMLKYVSEHNNFYKKIIKDYCISDPIDIRQYPVLTREMLQENRFDMFSDGYKSKYYLHELRHHSSSGSSGVPVNVYWSNIDYQFSMINLWRLRTRYYGIIPSNKKVMFSLIGLDGLNSEKEYYIQPAKNIVVFNRSYLRDEHDFSFVINVIDKFKPDWLYIQPSILNRLIQIYKMINRRPPSSIRYIECVGELFLSSLKKEAMSLFDAKIANMYGSEENNGIALECPNGLMHILKDNVEVEVINSNGICNNGRGQAIITNLNNHAMPLIRYAQGDIINLKSNECECKYNSSIISVIEGRVIDVISEGNNKIHAYILSEMINNVQNIFNDPIKNYKFVYYKKNKTLILLKE